MSNNAARIERVSNVGQAVGVLLAASASVAAGFDEVSTSVQVVVLSCAVVATVLLVLLIEHQENSEDSG